MSNEVPTIERAVYTVPEFAEILGISLRLAYQMVRDGQVKAIRPGGRKVVIPRRVVDDMLAGE